MCRRKRFFKRSDLLAAFALRCGNFILTATVPYNGPKPPIDSLLQDLEAAGSKRGIADYFSVKKLRQASVSACANEKFQLQDPIDILMAIAKVEPTMEN